VSVPRRSAAQAEAPQTSTGLRKTASGADTLALRVCPADYKSTHSAFRHARGSHRRWHARSDFPTVNVDGSLRGSIGNAVRREIANAAAAPATVSGESSVIVPLGSRVPGRRRKVVTREPGDLPSAVVTREHVGRGVLTEPSQLVRWYVWW